MAVVIVSGSARLVGSEERAPTPSGGRILHASDDHVALPAVLRRRRAHRRFSHPPAVRRHWAESVLLFQILSLFGIFYALNFCAQQILISGGRPVSALRLAVISAIVVPTFTLAGAPFGVVAATLVAGWAAVTVLPVAAPFLRVEVGLSVRRVLAEQIPLWFAAGAMALVVWLLPQVLTE